MELVTIDDIRTAARQVASHVVRTPLLEASWGDPDRPLWVKPESLQPIGAFKVRGAFNAIGALIAGSDPVSGVVAYSSGNHAQAVAHAAAVYGLPAHIVMPEETPAVKIDATRRHGARVVLCAAGQREVVAEQVAAETGAVVAGAQAEDAAFLDALPNMPEASSMESNASPALLNDIPAAPPPSLSGEQLDFSLLSPETRAAFVDVLGDPAVSSFGESGIGIPISGILNFFKSRMIDAGVGYFLMPIFNFIDEKSDTPWVSRSIQFSLATIGLVLAGDPFGVIAAPIMWGVQEYMRQRQRLNDNDDPEADQGKKFGYVREGKKWYPAILTEKTRDEGWLGSNKTEIRL